MEQLGPFDYEKFELPTFSLPESGYHEVEPGQFYSGQWKLKKRCGRGLQIWDDGKIYEGIWKEGIFNDFGRMIYANGDIYEGEFREGKMCGSGVFY